MWVWRPTNWGHGLFTQPHVEMLAHDWQRPISSPAEGPVRHRRQLAQRHRHHIHLRLHVAH